MNEYHVGGLQSKSSKSLKGLDQNKGISISSANTTKIKKSKQEKQKGQDMFKSIKDQIKRKSSHTVSQASANDTHNEAVTIKAKSQSKSKIA